MKLFLIIPALLIIIKADEIEDDILARINDILERDDFLDGLICVKCENCKMPMIAPLKIDICARDGKYECVSYRVDDQNNSNYIRRCIKITNDKLNACGHIEPKKNESIGYCESCTERFCNEFPIPENASVPAKDNSEPLKKYEL